GCGCVLFADPGVGRLYVHASPYTYFTSDDLHLGEISLECSRAGAAAAALWTTLRAFPLAADGLGAFLGAARRAGVELAARVAAAGAVEDRLGLVELPPVAAQPAHGQQPLVSVAEAHERADRRETRDLALPHAAPTRLEQLAFEQEAAGHVVGVALDRHRVAL